MISVDIMAVLASISFIALSPDKRRSLIYLLPYLAVLLVAVYENIGAYTIYNREASGWIYDMLYPNRNRDLYNLWNYNILSVQGMSLLYLSLIKVYMKTPVRKKMIKGIILLVFFSSLMLQVSGVQPLIDSQPIIFFICYASVILGCGFFFIELMTQSEYLEINPIEQFAFWQVTFIMFYNTMIFLIQISFNYLMSIDSKLLSSFYYNARILSQLVLLAFLITLAAPAFKWKMNKEQIYV